MAAYSRDRPCSYGPFCRHLSSRLSFCNTSFFRYLSDHLQPHLYERGKKGNKVSLLKFGHKLEFSGKHFAFIKHYSVFCCCNHPGFRSKSLLCLFSHGPSGTALRCSYRRITLAEYNFKKI